MLVPASWQLPTFSELIRGNCPTCGMAICERRLQDRINTDREAIFGQSITQLKVEERIDFPSHSQVVVCWSEEEVAAAQLRLFKDSVDYHADELHAGWLRTKFEPDWYIDAVAPVTRLFRG